jgi:type IV secretion system protein VirB9
MIARPPAFLPKLLGAAAPVLLLAGLAAPAAQAQDNRLVTVKYDPGKVIPIRGRVKVQATIRFADDERIENVAIGDSNAWQVTPNKRANLLFVKPLQANAATNMTVVTSERTYFFDLVASNAGKPVYVLNFEYPAGAKRKPTTPQLAADLSSLDAPSTVPPGERAVDPAALNFDWKRKGDKKLLPTRAYDDGEATFLVWPKEREVPAILMLADDGKTEGPVNFTVRGDTIVIDGVPSTIVLRAGKNDATLTYQGRPIAERQATTKASSAATGSGVLARNRPTSGEKK